MLGVDEGVTVCVLVGELVGITVKLVDNEGVAVCVLMIELVVVAVVVCVDVGVTMSEIDAAMVWKAKRVGC